MIDFGTGGFRGVIADSFNRENIQTIAQGIANIIIKTNKKKIVAIGYDYRFLSDKAAIWISEVFAGNGIRVILSEEPIPTPVVMHQTKIMGNDFGIMITASHNPYYFNGVKVFQEEGMDADIILTKSIEQEMCNISEINLVHSYEDEFSNYVIKSDFLNDYIKNIKNFVSNNIKGKNNKVLLDCIYGTGAVTLPRMAKEYDLKGFTAINTKHDAFFGGLLPCPTKENMLLNKEILYNEKYECVFGFDSDADRLGILDENGNYVDNNEILAALYYYLIIYRHEKGDAVKNCATSNLLDKVAINLGYNCHEVDVGFKNISSKLKEVDALIGGESSGGLTVRNYLFGKDSTFSAMLFIEMMINMNKKVSEIIKEVKDFADFHYTFIENIIEYNDNLDIKAYLKNNDPKFLVQPLQIKKFGMNVKYIFENDEWVLLRLSGTEPVLRIFVEAKNNERTDEYLNIINEYINDMERNAIK